MTDCCATSASRTTHPNKHRCPVNGLDCAEVPSRTISHHLKNSWQWEDKGLRYFYCDDPECDVIYFGEDDTVVLTSQLRTPVKSASALLCYCFGVTLDDALHNPEIRDFVVAQTRQGLCSCDTSNPSGRCCLKNFPHK